MWYKGNKVLSQIDFVLASASLESHCRVDYSLDCCSDHKPLAGSFLHRLPHSRTSRRRCCKGLAPKGPAEFCSVIRNLPSNASVGEIQLGLTDAMSSTVCVAPPRSRRSVFAEPEHVKEARPELAACTDPVNRHIWSKVLYRRKREWLRWQARERFRNDALVLPRADELSSGQVSWLADSEGKRSFDVSTWGSDIVTPFFSRLYTSSVESLHDKAARLAALESAVACERLGGNTLPLSLPLTVVLEIRANMKSNKAPGADGITVEVLKSLDSQCIDIIHRASERRLNGLETASVPDWTHTIVHCLPKTRRAHLVSQWRPISLISVFSKWYGGCLAFVLRTHAVAPTCQLLGFEPGRQTAEISEFFRLLLQRCEEWQLPLLIGKGDASKAFDNLEHPRLDEALQHRRVPLRLRAATLRELLDVSLHIRLQDSEADGIPLGKGGRQGAAQTPTEWNFLLDFALADTVRRWQDLGYGADLGDGLPHLTHCCWADDLFWLSASFDEFACTSRDLTAALADCHNSWKPDSLSFMANRVAAQNLPVTWCSAFPVLTMSGAPLWFERVEAMPCFRRPPRPYW